jgi:glycosyltransferase involved in cell wall biosynthesis
MRIALVSDTYTPQVNGITTVVERIVSVLRKANHAVAVVAPAYSPGGGPPGDDELRVPSLPFPPYPAIRLSLPRFHTVQRFLDRFEPDLVHVAVEGPLGLLGRRYAVERDVPLVTSSHTDFPQYCRYYGVPSLQPLAWRFLTWFHRAADLTHTPGEAMQSALAERGVAHVVRWGCGVDVEHFHPGRRGYRSRRAWGLREDGVVVLHVGRLAREKQIDVLIEAWRVAREALGSMAQFVIAGETARDTAAAAATVRETGLTIVYLPDCDRAGHAHGWMSQPYRAAAAEVDGAVGCLLEHVGDALMIVVSDHGGGGVRRDDHDLPHPLNDRITFVMAGASMRRGHVLEREVSILDVAPTVLWHFGLPLPLGYEGRVLHEAFMQTPAAAVA